MFPLTNEKMNQAVMLLILASMASFIALLEYPLKEIRYGSHNVGAGVIAIFVLSIVFYLAALALFVVIYHTTKDLRSAVFKYSVLMVVIFQLALLAQIACVFWYATHDVILRNFFVIVGLAFCLSYVPMVIFAPFVAKNTIFQKKAST